MTTRLPGSPRNILGAPLTTLATILVSAAIGTLAGCGDGTTGAPKPPASTKTTTPAATADANPPAPARPGVPQAGPPAPAGDPTPAAPAPPAAAPGWTVSTATSDPGIAEVGGLVFPKPPTWVWARPRMRFRTLQYDVPGLADSGGSAEIVFSLFNGTDGGPTDMNIDRWVNQFRTPEGDPAEAEITKTEVGGMTITRIETAGSYQSMGAAAPRSGQGQIGAIIEAPGRRVFVRLVGPEGTVNGTAEAFDAMLAGVMPAG
ncbi:MAG: hypothetical protein P8P71_14785 [Phycisphaerales bacterium]|nr:hypothetical protein [Phycisphaerales bacterium]